MNLTNLDIIFSKYIRLRDSNNGYITCITCNKVVKWQDSDCGHFIKRRHLNTRFNELNCFAQCKECNNSEKDEIFKNILIEKFGISFIEKLNNEKNKILKLSQSIINEKIKEFKIKIEKLHKL